MTPERWLVLYACELVLLVTVAFFAVWWKLQKIGMSWRQLHGELKNPAERPAAPREISVPAVWWPPQTLEAEAYRDDTGSKDAAA